MHVRATNWPVSSASTEPVFLIVAERLERRFGPVVAVADVSLVVASGEILALLGPNGAGKTTTLQMLAGLLPPTTGQATVAGYDVARAAHEVRARVGLMVDEPGFYPEMTIAEYLLFMARLYALDTRTARMRIDDLLARFDLEAKRGARLSSLSKGMRQKVALTRALLHRPPVLLLDEPTSSLDPLSARAVHRYIAERRDAGDAIILSTHQLVEAETLADRVAIIAAGRLQRVGTLASLRRAQDGQDPFILTLAGSSQPEIIALVQRLPDVRDLMLIDDGQDRHQLAYRTATADRTNAALIAALTAHGAAVLALAPQPRNLTAVYLETIEEALGVAGHDYSRA